MKILIISGAGILAGTNIYNRLVNKLIESKKFRKDSDFPEIVLYNYPFKSIKENGEIDIDLATEEIKSVYKNFEQFDCVILACNTFHIIDLQINNIFSLPYYAMKEFNESKHTKAIALCSSESRRNNLFSHTEIIYPNETINKLIDKVISRNIFKFNKYSKKRFQILNDFIEEKEISHVIVGCTELSLMDWAKIVNVPVIDSAESVINEVIEKMESSYESV